MLHASHSFHPNVLNLSFLPQAKEKAKLSMITTIEQSKDLLITEYLSLLSDPGYLLQNNIPSDILSLLEAAKKSTSEIVPVSKDAFKSKVKTLLHQKHACWNSSFNELQVQSKFKDIISIEPMARTWNRILCGLPAGRLSFLLQAGSDCLPTPLNLHHWRYRVCKMYLLCNSANPTNVHNLNRCQEALTQGRFTWQHHSVLNCLFHHINSDVSHPDRLYADLPGACASDSPPATLPVNITTSTARPDKALISGHNPRTDCPSQFPRGSFSS